MSADEIKRQVNARHRHYTLVQQITAAALVALWFACLAAAVIANAL